MNSDHRKQVKHYHEPGDLHELTFSCYLRMSLLDDDFCRKLLCKAIDAATLRLPFQLVAFVIMPEHVHLLVYPTVPKPELGEFLYAIKRPCSYRIKQYYAETGNELLERLTVRERPGKTTFRFWQEGPGYDRNLSQERTVLSAIDYIHLNPVRRGLVKEAGDWKWSSCRWYLTDKAHLDSDLPTIHGLPSGFF